MKYRYIMLDMTSTQRIKPILDVWESDIFLTDSQVRLESVRMAHKAMCRHLAAGRVFDLQGSLDRIKLSKISCEYVLDEVTELC